MEQKMENEQESLKNHALNPNQGGKGTSGKPKTLKPYTLPAPSNVGPSVRTVIGATKTVLLGKV